MRPIIKISLPILSVMFAYNADVQASNNPGDDVPAAVPRTAVVAAVPATGKSLLADFASNFEKHSKRNLEIAKKYSKLKCEAIKAGDRERHDELLRQEEAERKAELQEPRTVVEKLDNGMTRTSVYGPYGLMSVRESGQIKQTTTSSSSSSTTKLSLKFGK